MCSVFKENPKNLFLVPLNYRPMVVHPEGDQSKYGHVETDVPSGVGTLNIVLIPNQLSSAHRRRSNQTRNWSDECSESKR